jgi:hypothetical protein
MLRRMRAYGPVLLALLACAQPEPKQAPLNIPNVPNPTGNCPAPHNGARWGRGHSGSRWLPDCQHKLREHYFRVFAHSRWTATMLPRPDNVSTTRRVCEESPAGSELRTLFDRYTLCAEYADISKVNAMKIDDAVAIARALHQRLRFVATGGWVDPYAIREDVVTICKTRPELARGPLVELCEWELERDSDYRAGRPVPSIAREMDEKEATPLAAALNELYGIAL